MLLRLALIFAVVLSGPPVAWPADKGSPTQAAKDAFGDPLPTGAIARLGSLRRLSSVFDVSFSPDSKLFALAGEEASTGEGNRLILGPGLRVWDLPSGRLRPGFAHGDSWIRRVTFSPDGKLLAAIRNRSSIVFWDRATGAKLEQAFELPKELACFAFSADGKTLAGGGEPPAEGALFRIVHWDVATGKQLAEFRGHDQPVDNLAFSADGQRLVAVSQAPENAKKARSGRVIEWDLHSREKVKSFEPLGTIAPQIQSSDGRFRATVNTAWGVNPGHKALHLWDRVESRGVVLDYLQLGEVNCVAYSPVGNTLACGTQDGIVGLWDPESERSRLLSFPGECVTSLAFSADGTHLAAAGDKGNVRGWAVQTGRQTFHRLVNVRVLALRLSFDGKTILAAMGDGTLRSWKDGRTNPVSLHPQGVWTSAAFSPDGMHLVGRIERLSEGDPQLSEHRFDLWRLPGGKHLGSLGPLGMTCRGLAFSADGRFLASSESGGSQPLLRLWETATGEEVQQWAGHAAGAVTFSPDQRQLWAGVGKDWQAGAAVVWDLVSGKEVGRFEGHADRINCLAISPRGQFLVTASSDGTLLTWDRKRFATALPIKELSLKERKRCWADLLGRDAAVAHAALWRLVDSPAGTVPFLRDHLRPAAPPKHKAIPKLIANLDSALFVERQKATAQLEALAQIAQPFLEKALGGNISLEARRRIEMILSKVSGKLRSQDLRAIRAVAVLERIANREARDLVQALAKGAPEARLTEEANSTLGRWREVAR